MSVSSIHQDSPTKHPNESQDSFVDDKSDKSELRTYFSRWGKVINCIVKRDPNTGMSRGFGFVTFENEDALKNVLDVKEHYLQNRLIDPKKAKSNREPLRKVFVGGIDPELSEENIREYFGVFGEVSGLDLPYDSMKGRRRHYIFVTFTTEEAARKAIANERQNIFGRHCDVRAALTKNQAYRQSAIKKLTSAFETMNFDYPYDMTYSYPIDPFNNYLMNNGFANFAAAFANNGYNAYHAMPNSQMQRHPFGVNKTNSGVGILKQAPNNRGNSARIGPNAAPLDTPNSNPSNHHPQSNAQFGDLSKSARFDSPRYEFGEQPVPAAVGSELSTTSFQH